MNKSDRMIERHGARASDEGAIDRIDIRGLVSVLSRRWFLICAVAGFFAVVAAAYALMLPTRYAASATVMLNTRTLTVVDIESVLSNLAVRPETIESEITLIQSSTILGRVVDDLDLANDPEFNAALREPSATQEAIGALLLPARSAASWLSDAIRGLIGLSEDQSRTAQDAELEALATRRDVIATLRESVTISQIGLSVSISIRAMSESPRKAAEIANAVARIYLADQLDVKAEATENATQWLSDRVADQRFDLQEREAELKRLRTSTGVVDDAVIEEKNLRLETLRERIRGARVDLQAASDRLTIVDALIAEGAWVEAAGRLSREQTGGRLQRVIDGAVEADVAQAIVTSSATDLRRQVARLSQNLAALEEGVTRLEAEATEDSNQLVRLRQLESEVEATRVVYETLLTRLNETANQFGALQADARIVSIASPPNTPAEPRRTVIAVAGGVVGLMIGCAVAFLLEALTSRFRTARELELATNVPVLAHLPELKSVRSRSTFVNKFQTSHVALESAQALRTALRLSRLPKPGAAEGQAVMVTSSVPEEGKTALSLLLAHAEASVGRSVVVVDGDLRRPTLHRLFGSSESKDLIDVLDGGAPLDDALIHDEAAGIWVIGARHAASRPSSVVASQGFHTLIQRLRERFQIIVIDSPPVMLVSDALEIAKLADETIYAVRWNATSREIVKLGLGKLEQHGIYVAGTAVTRINYRAAKRFDSGQYGAYTERNPYVTS